MDNEMSNFFSNAMTFYSESVAGAEEERASPDLLTESMREEVGALMADFTCDEDELDPNDDVKENQLDASNSSSRLVDCSSLGLLRADDLSDFSVTESYTGVRASTVKTQANAQRTSSRGAGPSLNRTTHRENRKKSEVSNVQPKYASLNASDIDEKIKSLFGADSNEVKALLGESFYKMSKETFEENAGASSSIQQADDSINVLAEQINGDLAKVANETFKCPQTPVNRPDQNGKDNSSLMETPFTKLLKFNRPFANVSTASFPNPFEDRSSFEISGVVPTAEGTRKSSISDLDLLGNSDIRFSDNQISGRSTSIRDGQNTRSQTPFANSAASIDGLRPDLGDPAGGSRESSGKDWSMNVQQDDLGAARMSNMEQFGINESQFRDAEAAFLQDGTFNKKFMEEEEIDDSKVKQMSIWSSGNQPQMVPCPSFMDSSNISQISVGQLFAAKTENLGTLTEDPNRARPFFGAAVVTPPKNNSNHDSAANCDSPLLARSVIEDKSTVTNGPLKGNNVPDMSEISHLLASVSISDDPSVMVNKLLMSNKKFANKKTTVNRIERKVSPRKKARAEQNTFTVNNKASKTERASSKFSRGEKQTLCRITLGDEGSTSLKQIPKPMCNETSVTDTTESLDDDFLETKDSKHNGDVARGLLCSTALGTPEGEVSKDDSSSQLGACSVDFQAFGATNGHAARQCSENGQSSAREFVNRPCSSSSCCQHNHPGNQSRPNSVCSFACSSVSQMTGNKVCMMNLTEHHPMPPGSYLMPPGTMNFPPAGQQLHPCLPYHDFLKYGGHLAPAYMQAQLLTRPVSNYPMPLTVPNPTVNSAVTGPSELKFPCTCVGDSVEVILSLQSVIQTPLYLHLKLMFSHRNGSVIPTNLIGLVLPNFVQSLGSNPVDVLMTYNPKMKGETKVDLVVNASPSSETGAIQTFIGQPHVVKLILTAESPHIRLRSKDTDKLDFGSVLEESTSTDVVTLQNLGKADVPLRLTIDDEITELEYGSSFSFGNNFMPDSANVATVLYASPKSIFCRLRGSHTATQQKCDIPIIFKAGKYSQKKAGKPERVKSSIKAKLENTSTSITLSVVELSASIGAIQLCLKDPEELILLKVHKNYKRCHKLTLLNNGTIHIKANLSILQDCNYFSVAPNKVEMSPQQQMKILVNFHPLSKGNFKGLLQATPESCGRIFDLIPIIGEVLSSKLAIDCQPVVSSQETVSQSVGIESNKKYIVFGGVELEKDMVKTLSFRNPSSIDVQAKAVVEGETKALMLLDDTNQKVSSMELLLKSKATKQLKVVFCPKEKKYYNTRLSIKHLSTNKNAKCVIPLSGYGGVSAVKLVSLLEDNGSSYSLQLNSINNELAFNNISLCNLGCRAAFVKLIAVKDASDIHYEESRLEIQPSEFILKEQDSRSIHVTYAIDPEQSPNLLSKCGVLLVYFGDEALRQNMRRSNRLNAVNLHPVDTIPSSLRSIDFDVPYPGEEAVSNDISFSNPAACSTLFYSSMKKLIINVCIDDSYLNELASFSLLSVMQDSRFTCSMSTATRINENYSPPERDSSSKDQKSRKLFHKKSYASSLPDFRECSAVFPAVAKHDSSAFLPVVAKQDCSQSVTESLETRSENAIFSVDPESVKLDCDKRDERLLISNHSNHDLRFKLIWPGNIISASPSQGIILAKGEMGIRVKAVCRFDAKSSETCTGFIDVISSSEEKHVQVIVDKKMKKSKSKEAVAPSKTKPDSSLVPKTPSSYLKYPESVVLEDVQIGSHSETSFTMQNVGCKKLFWSMVPESIFINAASNVVSTMAVVPSYGQLEPSQSTTVVVNFSPPAANQVIETWKIMTETSVKKEFQIRFIGKGVHPGVGTDAAFGTLCSRASYAKISQHDLSKRLLKMSNLFRVEPETLVFPVTQLFDRSSCDIIMKNHDAHDCKVTIKKPEPPFSVSHSNITVKAAYYCKLPVKFMPSDVGNYESTLTLDTETGGCFRVTLKASSRS